MVQVSNSHWILSQSKLHYILSGVVGIVVFTAEVVVVVVIVGLG